jgi:hypothetical protein
LACRLRVKISPVYSVPVFLKVPMVAMFFLRFAVSGPRPCGLDGDRQPGGDHWRTPHIPGSPARLRAGVGRGAGQHRRNFLVPRGMAALPTGEESCDDAVAPKRSRRRCPSGRSAHHQRPLDAGWDRHTTEIKAILKARQERPDRHHQRWDHLLRSIWPACASPCPAAGRLPPLHRSQGCQRGGRQRAIFERGQPLGQCAGRSGLRLPSNRRNSMMV